MEVPEKIYIDGFGSELSQDWHTEHSYENDIEYTRTDVFIERACEWLRGIFSDYENLTDYNPTEDFKNYMKGE